jgi:hypothetical protein
MRRSDSDWIVMLNEVAEQSDDPDTHVLKRGLHGVYHHASPKHLARYVDEFAWRLNEGNVKRHSMERLASFVDAIVGKRLTYARLIAKVPA